MSNPNFAWRSRRGWFTLVRDPRAAGNLIPLEITEKQTKTIRLFDGFLYDREGFAQQAAQEWSNHLDAGRFLQFGSHSVFVLVRKVKVDG